MGKPRWLMSNSKLPAREIKLANRPSVEWFINAESHRSCSRGENVHQSCWYWTLCSPTTLKDRLSNPELKPCLSLEEKEDLAHFLVNCSEMGYGKTWRYILQMVKKIVVKKGVMIKKHVSDGWFHSADAHDLEHKPGRIYNCDENRMPFDAWPLNVITSKKLKKVRSQTSGNKSQTTILACARLTCYSVSRGCQSIHRTSGWSRICEGRGDWCTKLTGKLSN